MTRSVFAAVLCLLAGSHAKSYSPKSSAELEAAFLVVKPSDSIKLESGMTYKLTKPLSLSNIYQVKIEGGRSMSTLDGSGLTRIFQLSQAQEVSFKNIIFKNGNTDSSSPHGSSGGAGLLSHCSSITFDGCSFVANSAAGSGGALWAEETVKLSVSGGSFTGNRASANGGAVALLNSDNADLNGALFVGNAAQMGGGLAAHGGDGLALESCRFNANSATNNGPAIFLNGVSESKVGLLNTFEGNTAESAQPVMPLYIEEGTVSYTYANQGLTVPTQCGGGPAEAADEVTTLQAEGLPTTADVVTISDVSVSKLPESVEPSDLFVRVHGAQNSKVDGPVGAEQPPLHVLANKKPEMMVEVFAKGEHRPTSLGKTTLQFGDLQGGSGTWALEGRHGGGKGNGRGSEPTATPEVTLTWSLSKAKDSTDGAPPALVQAARARAEGVAPQHAGFAAGVVAGAGATALVAAAAAVLTASRRRGSPLPMA